MTSVKDIRRAQSIADVYVPEISDLLNNMRTEVESVWFYLRNEAVTNETLDELEPPEKSPSRRIEQARRHAKELQRMIAELRAKARKIGETQRNMLSLDVVR